MKPGRHTSEFWLTTAWAAKAFASMAALFPLAWHSPWSALVCVPAVSMLVWMAGPIVNNYCENRYLLKRGGGGEEQEAERPSFGFRHVPAPEQDEEEDEE